MYIRFVYIAQCITVLVQHIILYVYNIQYTVLYVNAECAYTVLYIHNIHIIIVCVCNTIHVYIQYINIVSLSALCVFDD